MMMNATGFKMKMTRSLSALVFLPYLALADVPAATYSLSFDGNATTASSVLGGSALPIAYSAPTASDYVAVRDSETDKAFVGSNTAQPWSQDLDVFQQGGWSMLTVARGAAVANGVYWDVGWCAWESAVYEGQQWCTGFSLVRQADGSTALVRRCLGQSPATILSAKVDNDTTKFHVYLVTHNPNAAGTEESPYFVLYVDGVKVAQSTTLYQVWRKGYQFCGVYGGAPNANLANGIGFAVDEVGIWQSELTAAQAAEVSAHYPVWPNITRFAAVAAVDSTFSTLGWTPAWEDSSSSIGRVTVADGVAVTIDTAPTAYALEFAGPGTLTLQLGESGSLANVQTVSLKDVLGKVTVDPAVFPSLGAFQLADTVTVRVEGETIARFPTSAEGYFAMLNKAGQSLEIAAPLEFPTVDGSAHLKIGQTQGTQTLVLEDGVVAQADRLTLGAMNNAAVSLVQKGGSVTLNGTGRALSIAAYPVADSSYALQGGTCDVSAGEVYLGLDGATTYTSTGTLVIGGGEAQATMRASGICSSAYRSECHSVTVKTNGVLELGSAGLGLAGANAKMVLEGGTVKAVASSSWKAVGGIQIDGDATVEVASGVKLVVSGLKGAGTLTKTGAGVLVFLDANPAFTGTVDVREGSVAQADRDAWFDFTFTRAGLPDRQVATRNVRNDGYAGTSAALLLDGTWTGTTGYDAATGLLKLQTTPCRDMTDACAWPAKWTVVLAAQIPEVADLCLLGLGSTYFTTKNFLALATGTTSGSLRLVKGNGYAAGETLAEMSIPVTSVQARHLFAITYDGTTCTVYHADGNGKMQAIGSCALPAYALGGGFQVGSIHGGVGGTGLSRANEVSGTEGCGIRAVRVFETVLSTTMLEQLNEELVRQHGTCVIVR